MDMCVTFGLHPGEFALIWRDVLRAIRNGILISSDTVIRVQICSLVEPVRRRAVHTPTLGSRAF